MVGMLEIVVIRNQSLVSTHISIMIWLHGILGSNEWMLASLLEKNIVPCLRKLVRLLGYHPSNLAM